MQNDKDLGFIGLLFKAHRAEIGEMALSKIKDANYAFVASDASENTLKKVNLLLERYLIPHSNKYTKEELGHALGYGEVSLVVVLDKKAAKKIATRED